ncbi:FAD-binding oxidoreductase [Algoriphagus namhaensis]|uniref:FAD-binding oxidoreductase n=1 Tax=Algoriphagus namhaensis TaxID=915353 RepID=A0ABV8AY61_9BACT
MSHTLKLLQLNQITHDVYQFRTEKPDGYTFSPGQATELALNKQGWKDEKRPFTFTSLPEDPFLEFTIKSYPSHDGVTKQIAALKEGDEVIIDDAWGAIEYHGKGVFIAGGAGITPFISIFRKLEKENNVSGHQLYFANKTSKDVIMESYFRDLLGDNFISVLADENSEKHKHGLIDYDFLKSEIGDFNQEFYVCGPNKMVEDISGHLKKLGANPDGITFEQ